MRIKCLAQEHNTMSLARARTWTARSDDECTNHEATAPQTPPLLLTDGQKCVQLKHDCNTISLSREAPACKCFCKLFQSVVSLPGCFSS